MVLKSLIQRKISSLLQPWLLHELELELNLGFIRSHGITKNLRFDISALNQLLDDSTSFSFTEVRVDQLTLRVSNWSAPAFNFEVHGVHVALQLREGKEGGGARISQDTALEDMKKALYEIDPEGCALHDVMERISKITCSKSWKTSLLNVMLTHCCLQMHGINLLVQSNIADGSYSCSLEIEEFNAESQHIESGSLISGITSSLTLPSREICFDVDIKRSKIQLKHKDQITTVLSLTEFLSSIKLIDLQMIDLHCRVPELDISFSPTDISIILVFTRQLAEPTMHMRTGRQLWSKAAYRIRSLISAHKWHMRKVISVVCLWLRYIRAYETLLLLIGYPADNLIKRSAIMMYQDGVFSRSVKHQWNVIFDIEKELPTASIALARRVVRYRAATNFVEVKNEMVNSKVKFYWKILHIPAFIWNTVCWVLYSMLYLIFWQKKFVAHPKMNRSSTFAEEFLTNSSFSVIMGNILVSFSPERPASSYGGGKTVSTIEISSSELLSFFLSVDAFWLNFNENVCEHRLSFSYGSLKVLSSSAEGANSSNDGSWIKEHQKKRVNDSKVLVWGKPAFISNHASGGTDNAESGKATVPLLETLLQQMWSDWRESYKGCHDSGIQYSNNPFIVCEIEGSLTDRRHLNSGCRSWKCSLAVGELEFVWDYSSLLSFSLLLRQMEALWLSADRNLKPKGDICAPTTCEDPPGALWDINSYISGADFFLAKMFPEKLVQVGVFIVGPRVRVSLERIGKASTYNSLDYLHLSLDFGNIELALSPTLACTPSTSNDAEPECLGLKEPEIVDIPKSNDETYGYHGRILLSACLKFNGLDAYLDASDDLRHAQVLVLNPVRIQLSSVRQEVHSLGETVIAFSTSLHGIATGLTVLVFIDEFTDLVKVVVSLSSAVSSDAVGSANSQNLIRQELFPGRSESTETSLSRVGGASLISMSTRFVTDCTLEIHSMDLVLHKSRTIHNKEDQVMSSANLRIQKLAQPDLPDNGICVSVHRVLMEFLFKSKDREMKVLTNLYGLRVVIFRFASEILKSSNRCDLKKLLLKSLDCLYEVSVFNCKIALWLNFLQNNLSSRALDASTSAYRNTVGSRAQLPDSCSWLLLNVSSSEIYLVGCPAKDIIAGAHQANKLEALLSIGGEHQTKVSCQCQGGSFIFEAKSVAILCQCFTSYLNCIRYLFPVSPSSNEHILVGPRVDLAIEDDHPIEERLSVLEQVKWGTWEGLNISVSQFSLSLIDEDELGRLHELLLNANIQFELDVVDLRKKFSFGLSDLSVLSQVLHESSDQKGSEIQISFFSSGMSNASSSHSITENSRVPFQDIDGIGSVPYDASSNHYVSSKEWAPDNSGSQKLQKSPQFYILKQLRCYVSAEETVLRDSDCPLNSNQAWTGGGSITGFDMTISLTEMQMISSAAESLSGVSHKGTTGSVEQRYLSGDGESERNLEEICPDGTVVAIQDVHQHMYITVECAESKYSVGGAIHHSLAGKKALFRVKYHHRRSWTSSVLYFSLTSLHAKSESGEPLLLSCCQRSSFVTISSSYNSGSVLWRALPCRSESYGGDTELEAYSTVEKRTFHLVNKKNGYAIAFIDGVLEFVNKPGNPFKLKVFSNLSLTSDHSLLSSMESAEAHGQNASYANGLNTEKSETIPRISITFDKLYLTIVHELSDTKEKFPLLQASISVPEFIVQILCTKARVMTRLVIDLYYFDGQHNSWREFVHPVELCIFYRSRFHSQGPETVSKEVPVHFFASLKKLDISITELALDILLYAIGNLNLAGPYAVRSSVILANCCKVENQSGLVLLCHFPDNQHTSVAGKQSTTMFLRHLAVSPSSEASFVSIQLAEGGAITTSPIHFPLLETGVFAWRTRLVSRQDSKSYPGPFLVVETSRKAEDGLSIVVSPLIRIHNATDFPMELRFLRPQQEESEHASVVVTAGSAIDDSMAAFGAIKYSGGLKKALRSLSIGNFLFSFRPKISDEFPSFMKSPSVDWSDNIKGGKATRLSGLFDKLNYQVRKAFPVGSAKCSYSTSHSSLKSEDGNVANVHFLIRSIERDVPIVEPNSSGYVTGERNSAVALQKQKEIYLLPTVQISNFLQSEIYVLLTDPYMASDNVGKQATIPCGSTINLYANPEMLFFTVTLTALSSSCKPVNCGDWARKLQKQKKDVCSLDIELDFADGKYFALLRLSCGHSGILEAAIFTSYTLKNDTDFGLFFLAPSQKPLSRDDTEKLGSVISPELGMLLSPKSTKSWFMRSNKVRLQLLEDKASESMLDLDALSGLTEIDLEVEGDSSFKCITKLGVSLRSSMDKVVVPSQIVSFSPRYILVNESEDEIVVRQCYLEDDSEGMIAISGRQRKALQLRSGTSKPRETSIFENFIRKHRNVQNDTLLFIQFQPKEGGFGWSGPICIASLGRFYLKFRRSLNYPVLESKRGTTHVNTMLEFAVVHVIEEDSTLVLHFRRPPNINLPYRIENYLNDASITYYQKGLSEPETLGSACCVDYVWDDLTLPHKLVIQINDVRLLREINLDKVRAWKPLFRSGQQKALGFYSSLDKKAGGEKRGIFSHFNDMKTLNLGYEVYADGLTRVLRICEFDDRRKQETVFYPGVKMTVRVSDFTVQLSERVNQEIDSSGPLVDTPIIVMRMGNIILDSMLTDQYSLNRIRVQSLSVDQKWVGAPFAAMLRRHQSEYDANDSMLRVVLILLPSSSNIKQIKYSSIILQPIDLKLDEETLMKIVPFWRTSLSDPSTPSQQYYFDHFEIHPFKIIASFLPGDTYSSYSSTQETLRSLLHSVIKVPQINNKTVELNGVLVTHALITVRELSIKCAQHYSWYIMRAVYIAKGSPLLPPAFASIFDDLASSSLDVFFDPSSGAINLPGVTIGTFKLLSKCIDGKGLSGTKRYFGDLGKTLRAAGSNILFAAVTEVSDSVLRGAEISGFNGMINGFHQGLLKLAMEPSVLGSAFMEGGPDRKIKLDRNPGVEELYIEGYLQAMLDAIYKQEYLRVRVVDNQVILKNLPPNSSLIDDIVDRVKSFLVSKGLLKGGTSNSYSLRHLRGESEWRIGPTILTLCEHLFVSFAIRGLRMQAGKAISRLKLKLKDKVEASDKKDIIPGPVLKQENVKLVWKWGIGKFIFSGIVAYLDGRLCRCIPNPIARRIVSGFLLSFLDQNDSK